MTVCITCRRDFERDSGPMICMCSDCLKAPSAPDSYHAAGGVFVPNPAYDIWKKSEAERIRRLNPDFKE